MYARGISAREIVEYLREHHGIDFPDLVRAVRDADPQEIASWQARAVPLVSFHTFVALRVSPLSVSERGVDRQFYRGASVGQRGPKLMASSRPMGPSTKYHSIHRIQHAGEFGEEIISYGPLRFALHGP